MSFTSLPGMQLIFSHLQEPNTYPGPLTEVDFWTERAANLNSIHQQLSSERVRKVAKVLELVKSTYYPAFNRCQPPMILLNWPFAMRFSMSLHMFFSVQVKSSNPVWWLTFQAVVCACLTAASVLCRLLKDVNTACLEANDTVRYLKPLRKYLEKMNTMDDFTALVELFKPMFHTMLLIWKHSGYYNTSAKMVTLIREMCNDLIMQACKFVPGRHLSLVSPVIPEPGRNALHSFSSCLLSAPFSLRLLCVSIQGL